MSILVQLCHRMSVYYPKMANVLRLNYVDIGCWRLAMATSSLLQHTKLRTMQTRKNRLGRTNTTQIWDVSICETTDRHNYILLLTKYLDYRFLDLASLFLGRVY